MTTLTISTEILAVDYRQIMDKLVQFEGYDIPKIWSSQYNKKINVIAENYATKG